MGIIKPEMLYALYLLAFPYLTYSYFTKPRKLSSLLPIYLLVITLFYTWMYFIGSSVLIFEFPILAVMGIVQILKLIALHNCLEADKLAAVKSSFRNYYIYLATPAEVVWNPKDIDVSQRTKSRLRRGLVQLAALVVFNFAITRFSAYHYHVADLSFIWRGVIAGLQLSLCFQALSDLCLSLFGYVFPDIYLEEVFNYPILATSPRDFWGKRWNLIMQKYIGKMVYTPLGGKNNKALALIVTYIAVGIAHELPLLFLPSAKSGYWLSLFVMHAFAMMAQIWLEQFKLWAHFCNNAAVQVIGRVFTLSLLALTAELAYAGFGLTVESMAKDFNKVFLVR